MITIENFSEVLGSTGADNLIGSDLDALYGLAGNDTLGAVENTEDVILIGGSGDDLYEGSNNSTLIVVENGNDDNDVGRATGIGFNKDTSFSLEIDEGRHLYVGDTASNQYALLFDWQTPENRIETFELEDGTFSYQDVNGNIRSSPGYLGSVTWEEAISQEAFDLERIGLSIDTIDEAIAQVNTRSVALESLESILNNRSTALESLGLIANNGSAALESQDSIGNLRDVVGSEGDDNILGSNLQILYGLEGNDTLATVEGLLPDGLATTFLVGGSGDTRYRVGNNSTTMVIENGNTDNDVGQATGIGFNKDTSFSLEIDEARHLLVGDLESNQYAFLIDWQDQENRIESFELEDGTFSYQDVVDNFRFLPGYLGSFTWEALGISSAIFDEAIAQVNARSASLEAQDPVTGEIVYRFFDPTAGGHLYTTDVVERDYIVDNLDNYNFEGASYKAADPLTGSPVSVYRFFNPSTGVHLYTIDEVEKDYIIENLDNFSFEGEKFSAYREGIGSTIPIYRFYEPSLGVHFYTPSEVEKDFVEDNLSNYNFEGIAYYANPVDFV